MNNPAQPISGGVNNQCVFLGGQCVVAWDLSPGPTAASCPAANNFADYIRDGAPNANQEGGIFATQGARVLAGNNNWMLTSPTPGLDFSFSADGNSLIVAESGCASSGTTCTEPPPPPAQ
jgi:hypothetical protein